MIDVGVIRQEHIGKRPPALVPAMGQEDEFLPEDSTHAARSEHCLPSSRMQVANLGLALPCAGLFLPGESLTQGPIIMGYLLFRHPAFGHQIFHSLVRGRRRHVKCRCYVFERCCSVPMQVEHHAGLQWRHSKRSQRMSQRTVKLQHLFKQGRWRDTRLVDGPGLAVKVVVPHFIGGFHSRTRCCARKSWAGVIRLARASRSSAPEGSPCAAPRVYHL